MQNILSPYTNSCFFSFSAWLKGDNHVRVPYRALPTACSTTAPTHTCVHARSHTKPHTKTGHVVCVYGRDYAGTALKRACGGDSSWHITFGVPACLRVSKLPVRARRRGLPVLGNSRSLFSSQSVIGALRGHRCPMTDDRPRCCRCKWTRMRTY